MIKVEGLTKDYGIHRAIEDLTFSVDQNEIVGFLGPNGAGKTTTMRILCGYMPPTNGKAEVAGFDVVDESLEVRKRVGYMPETVPLYPDMTVFEYLNYMAQLRHLKNIEERIMNILELMNLEDRIDGYISKLSKGLRQRVGLAQAILHDPEVLILDEPTIGLDPNQIIEVRNLIHELGKRQTILLSTHILSEAQQVCNKILIINKGKIVAQDTPKRLEARISGAKRFRIQVRGETDGLGEIIKKLDGVSDIFEVDEGVLELETMPDRDPRAEIVRTIVQNGYDLIELRPVGISLEDIFLQLTKQETP